MLWALILCKYVHFACVDHNFKYFYRLHATAAKLQCLTNKHFEPVLVCCGFFFKTQKVR